ncbi:MAG: DnaD domain protein [Firmicutes bacterium]|nr:DnaD domain protein [Bacillota bacterium]
MNASVKNADMLIKNLRFSQDLSGESCLAPMLLLREYRRFNLNESQLPILLRLLYLRQKRGALYPEDIAREFACSPEAAADLLSPFVDAGLINDYDGGRFYQFDGLYRLLYEQWVICQRRQGKAGSAENLSPKSKKKPAGGIYYAFEQEMGRSLSFKENQQIRAWLNDDHIPEELLDEALRRAVLQGVMQGNAPLAYIDKILLSWQKRNLTSLEAVLALDQDGRKPAAGRGGRSEGKKAPKGGDDYSEVYK